MVPGSARNWIAVNAAKHSNPKKSKKNMTTFHLRNSVNRPPSWRIFFLIPLVLVCLALAPTTLAVTLLEKGIVSPHEAFMKAIDKNRFKPFLSAEEEALANAVGAVPDDEKRAPGIL